MKMRHRAHAAAVPCAVLVLGTVGCATGQPAERPSTPSATAIANIFTTQHRTTVIDDGDRPPQLCIGGVAQSLPPQCAGIDLEDWDWSAVGDHEQQGSVRWGSFVVAGEYSAPDNSLRVTSVSADGTDPRHTMEPCADGSREKTDPSNVMRIWEFIEEDLGVRVFSGGDVPACGSVEVRVGHDDGSIQSAVDAEFGAGTASVDSALVPAP
ncbi:MAG: hypothetical protein ACTHY8_00030 [Microbacterium gubbeenense]|uniref:hypothetical protein n=1 Tax=Microbacterium gubbeenense TaxID=159896 RepID=UPI0004229A4B|nr:hypothetical protein [Microbacterium gubbeenense]